MSALGNSLLVFVGAGLGANARYWIGEWLPKKQGLPWATIAVNISGSILLGVFLALFLRGGMAQSWRLFVAVGLLGGYTTFSSFAFETVALWREGMMGAALLNVLVSNLASIGGCALAFVAVEALVEPA